MKNNILEKTPLVSVIMPTYNGKSYIEQALISVLNQEYPHIDIFVCDDNSKDQTPELIQKIKTEYDHNDQIHIISQKKNQGISKNMNTGLEAADGKYIAILDQDDMWLDSHKIQKQVDFLEQNTDHGIVGTNAIFNIYGAETYREYPSLDQNIRKSILGSCPMLHSSVVYHKELARGVGGYAESYQYAMDYKLFLDLMKKNKGANISDITTYYRRHGNNTSIIKAKEQREEAKNIRQEHKSDFPNWTKAIICYKTVSLLNDVFGDNPTYIKLKNEAKKIYFRAQKIL